MNSVAFAPCPCPEPRIDPPHRSIGSMCAASNSRGPISNASRRNGRDVRDWIFSQYDVQPRRKKTYWHLFRRSFHDRSLSAEKRELKGRLTRRLRADTRQEGSSCSPDRGRRETPSSGGRLHPRCGNNRAASPMSPQAQATIRARCALALPPSPHGG